MSDYESVAYHGAHQIGDPTDWRTGWIDQWNAYGNWCGTDNRAVYENRDFVEEQRRLHPYYDEVSDPRFAGGRYAAIDGFDEAGRVHDQGYNQRLSLDPETHARTDAFQFRGMNDVREVDRELVRATSEEMRLNGHRYDDDAIHASQRARGYFGGRVMAGDAADWVGARAGEAVQGTTEFAHNLASHPLSEAGHEVSVGLQRAGNWLGRTGRTALTNVEQGFNQSTSMGWRGAVGTALGLTHYGVEAARYGAHQAGTAISETAHSAYDGARQMSHRAGTAISETAHSAYDGARQMSHQAGTAISETAHSAYDGARQMSHQAGTAISETAHSAYDGARESLGGLGHGIADTARHASSGIDHAASQLYDWIAH